MVYLSCPKCKAAYSVVGNTISPVTLPVNYCPECGWTTFSRSDYYAPFFTLEYVRSVWSDLLAGLNPLIPNIDSDLAWKVFHTHLSCQTDKAGRSCHLNLECRLFVRGHLAFNVPYKAVEYGKYRPQGRLISPVSPDIGSLLTDYYRMPVLFVVSSTPLAVSLRYYSALADGAPVQVYLLPRCNARDARSNYGLFQPERIIGLNLTPTKVNLLRRTLKTPVFTYTGPVLQPLQAFARALETEVRNVDIQTPNDDPRKYTLDPKKIRAAIESLDIPVLDTTDTMSNVFSEDLLTELQTAAPTPSSH